MAAGFIKASELKKKFTNIQKDFNLPMTFIAAIEKDGYRKPAVNMWDYFVQNLNEHVEVNMKKSFYCGDAAGRPKTATTKKDHSDSDRKFAINLGIQFYTPETYFEGIKEKMPPLKDNKKLLDTGLSIIKGGKPGDEKNLKRDKLEVVMFVGAPGCGKSTFW